MGSNPGYSAESAFEESLVSFPELRYDTYFIIIISLFQDRCSLADPYFCVALVDSVSPCSAV